MKNQVKSEKWQVESGKSRLRSRGLKGFSFHFELCTFHPRPFAPSQNGLGAANCSDTNSRGALMKTAQDLPALGLQP
jgi:hypothetical protein